MSRRPCAVVAEWVQEAGSTGTSMLCSLRLDECGIVADVAWIPAHAQNYTCLRQV